MAPDQPAADDPSQTDGEESSSKNKKRTEDFLARKSRLEKEAAEVVARRAIDMIDTIDRALSPLFAELVSAAQDLAFVFICDLSDAKTIAAQNYKGIYLIEVHTASSHTDFDPWALEFRAEWDLPEYHRKFTCTTKDKRIQRHGGVLKEWMPLYIGKSRNVADRVKQHLILDMEARTFALKFRARPNMAARQFRLSTLKLDVNNYDLIAPVLEKALRDRVNPIIGKQ